MDSDLQLAGANGGALPAASGLTRRRLLRLGGAGLVAAAGAESIAALTRGGPTAKGTAIAAERGLTGLRRSDYAPHLGQRFTLVPSGGPSVPTRLAAIEDFPGAWARSLVGSEDAFILIFHAPHGAPRPGRPTMTVEGPLGSLGELSLSPAGPGHHGLDYAAVINRVLPNGGPANG